MYEYFENIKIIPKSLNVETIEVTHFVSSGIIF